MFEKFIAALNTDANITKGEYIAILVILSFLVYDNTIYPMLNK